MKSGKEKNFSFIFRRLKGVNVFNRAHCQLQGTGHLAQGHAGGAPRLDCSLLHGVRDMDESTPDGEVFLLNQVEQCVHDIVADISAGRIGNKSGNAVLFQSENHTLNGQG